MRNDDELDTKVKKYLRGEGANLEALQDKKLKGQLAIREELYGKSARAAAKIEKWLLPSAGGFLEAEGIEKTWRIRQEYISREVDIASSRNQYDVVLPELGPYKLNFTSSGRYMVAGGRKGHLAIVEMRNLRLIRELQVMETVRDVVFLHNELFFAAAQKKFTYIYNRDGTELHCLREQRAVTKLEFLKNHFLLASRSKDGHLHYQDVTTGEMVSNHRIGDGRCDAMSANPTNGVIGLGHTRGVVTMWKPTSSSPVVKMLCHQGPVAAVAFHPSGLIMATSGADGKLKLWDLRRYQVLQPLALRAASLDFSQKGLLAASAAGSSFVQVWSDHTDRTGDATASGRRYGKYMSHSYARGCRVARVAFRPYEDVLAIGHSVGWSSILIPGSGEPNFDSFVANPFETARQRREKEVRMLLDKLPPETIMLDPTRIGTVRPLEKKKANPTERLRDVAVEVAVAEAKEADASAPNKMKGRSRPGKRVAKKKQRIEVAKRTAIADDSPPAKKLRVTDDVTHLPKALHRFVRTRTL